MWGRLRDWSYPYYTDFVMVPALACAVAWRAPISLVGLAFGLVLFTLAEYVVHRWVLHGLMWHGTHEHHHTHPHDYQVFTWWQLPSTYVLTALILPPSMFVGFMIGVLWFLCWHHMLHHWSHDGKPWIARYDAWHDLHHKDLPVNYGITHGAKLWDFVFGTYMSLEDGRDELFARAYLRERERKGRATMNPYVK